MPLKLSGCLVWCSLISCGEQGGEPKVDQIFERAREMGATQGSIDDLRPPGSSSVCLLP